MRTVIIATKQHIDWIYRYRLFLDSFLDPEAKLCQWNREGSTIDEMLPDIYDCIGGHRDWRAIVIFDDEKTRGKINPFDVVEVAKEKNEVTKEESIAGLFKEYVDSLHQKTESLKNAYEKASQNPLTRLCTFLCSLPLDANEELIEDPGTGDDRSDRILLQERRETEAFNQYKSASNYKRKLREQILGDERLQANLPREMYCLSTRTILDESGANAQKLDLAWKSHTDVMYTDFVDRNMYFDRMRFFVYDILPSNHVNYKFNYLEFICTLLVLSANGIPSDATMANRLYAIESSFSENRLHDLLTAYDYKLENTVREINKRQKEVEDTIPGPLTDMEAERLFHSNNRIEVLLDPRFDMEGFFADETGFGLAGDCPTEERTVWYSMYHKSDLVMHKLMKQPRRSLEKATEELRKANKEESKRALGLNHFQLEDIKEYVDNEEDRMVSVKTKDFYDIERYEKDMSDGNQAVKDVIETRMTRKTTVILGIIALVVFFIGFIPVIFFNKSVTSVPIPALMTLIAVGVLAVTAFIVLFFLRGKLIESINGFNGVMKGIKSDVDDSMDQFSKLLSHICHVMKGNYVLGECRKKDNSFKQHIRILRGHIQIIRDLQSQMRELFGEYLGDHPQADAGDFFDYNFDIVKEYEYPIPVDKSGKKTILFIEEGNNALVPFDFIDSIKLRMEELYE